MFSLIRSVIKSIELYLKLKNKKFYYDLHKEFKERERKLVKEIEELRIRGDSHSSDRADLLRNHLDSERREFEHLSTFYSEVEEK